MGAPIDLTGQRFGRLTVIELLPERKNKKRYWKCKCDCGNYKKIDTASLRGGHTKSCGCLEEENRNNHIKKYRKKQSIIGKKYGMLEVLKDSGKRKKRKIVYECKCDCGNIIYKTKNEIINSKLQSCGCNRTSWKLNNDEDLLGKRYGKWKVIEVLRKYKHNKTFCKCKCDCGNISIVDLSNLNSGTSTNCGCERSNGLKEYYKHLEDDDRKIYVVYRHITPNGKSYIGMTVQEDLDSRWKHGLGYKNQVFYNAIQKYGWDNIEHIILEKNLSHNEACEKEMYYINLFESNIRKNGYNISPGGEGIGTSKTIGLYKDNKIIDVFKTQSECAKRMNVSTGTIRRHIKKKTIFFNHTLKQITINDYLKYSKTINKKQNYNILKDYITEYKKIYSKYNLKNIN